MTSTAPRPAGLPTLALLALTVLLAGCASGEEANDDPTRPPLPTTPTIPPTSDEPAPPSTDVHDGSAPADATDSVESTLPDVPSEPGDTTELPPSEDDPRRFCDDIDGTWVGDCQRPFQRDCGPDGRSIVFCGACGDVVSVEQQCNPGDVCEVPTTTETPICRRCIGDECEDEDIECDDGTSGCLTWNQPWRCASGVVRPAGACTNSLCIDGACADGALQPNSQFCSYGVDCQGDLCICGVDFGSTSTEGGCADMPNGYCAKRDCLDDVCNSDTEVCVDWSVNQRYGGTPACLLQSGCEVEGASCAGFGPRHRCVALPTRTSSTARLAWELACWPDNLARIGEPCFRDAPDAPSDCIGGDCRAFSVGAGRQVTYCTMPCGDSADCPSGTSCVRHGNETLCMAHATDPRCSCPLAGEDSFCSDFDLQNRDLGVFGATGNQRVCYYFMGTPLD
ncbi:MAG: hypothetical protein EA398_04830 [Deltaproteobacteria bacterium]|nr:MAG: hypothetical protein EA398_04830 [Deltaproteobacteria bacterium]